jgi:hypothetical protein
MFAILTLKAGFYTFIVPTLSKCICEFVKSMEFPLNSSALNALMLGKDVIAGPTELLTVSGVNATRNCDPSFHKITSVSHHA